MRHLSRKVVFVVTAIAVAVMPLASQAPAQKPAFEVVSVKPNRLGRAAGPPRVGTEAGRFVASNADLMTLLQFAYHPPSGRTLRFMDIIGLLDWADSGRFDVEGVDGRPLGTRLDVQMRLMVQSLLEDRFQLKAHWD